MNKFLSILFCFLSTVSFAQTAAVRGLVKDGLSQKVLDSATVGLVGTDYKAQTNADGVFVITGVPYGRYTIEVKEANHATYTQLIDVNQPEVVAGSFGLDAPKPAAAEEVAEKVTEREDAQEKALVDVAPTVTLSEEDAKDLGDQSAIGSIGASRDVFVSTTAIVMSEARFRVRGYNPGQTEVFMNGVPMNDLGTGNALTSSWGGLNNVLHNRDITIGLNASENSFGGVGGSYSLDTRASSQRQGLTVSYSRGNRNFSNRLMGTYSTGVLKSGWAVTASFTRRWAIEGYVPGSTYDGYSYHFSVDKHFGAKHILSFTTFGASTRDGVAEAETKEAYSLAGSNYYNYAWGYQNGVKRNAFVRNTFQPEFILNHEWKIKAKSKLVTAAGFSFGKNEQSGIAYNNAPNPNPTYYKNMPGYNIVANPGANLQDLQQGWINHDQIDWANFYDVNRNSSQLINNIDGISGNNQTVNISRYALYNRVSDVKRFNFNTTYNTEFNKYVTFTAGLKYQFARTENYWQMADLLGGKKWWDVNQYAPLSYPGNDSVAQSDLNHFQRLVNVGDKFDNDYVTVEHRATAWAQSQFHFKHLEAFVAAQLKYTAFWRDGLYRTGLFPNNSFGKSTTQNFINYAVKGGLVYKINNQHFLYANGACLTQAPNIIDAYVSASTRDQVAPGLSNEQVFSGEAGYVFKTPNIKLRASFFVSQFNNQTQTTSYFDYDLSTFVNNTLTGMNSRHLGGELAFEAKVYKGFSVSAVGTLGKYIYTNRPSATVTDDNTAGALFTNETIYIKNYNLGGGPQLATSLGLSYHSPQYWFVDLYLNYYGMNWVTINPQRRTVEAISTLDPSSATYQQVIAQEKLPDAFTMDLFAGYNWFMNKQFHKMKKYKYYLAIGLNVSNMTNNRNFITRGYEQLSFDDKTKVVAYHANKYVYSYGTNYLLTLTFKMN